VVEQLATQLAKIAQINPNVVEQLATQLAKIAQINSDVVEQLATQLAKIAQTNPTVVEQLATQLAKVLEEFPKESSNIVNSMSDGQLLSKAWLIDQVKDTDLGVIFLCAGWYGTVLLDNKLKFSQCISIDSDPSCEKISKILNKKLLIDNWKFQAVTGNIHSINYSSNKFIVTRSNGSECDLDLVPDTVINTSCEHIENFENWYNLIPQNKLIIVQSNNGFNIEGHVNCSPDLEHFAQTTPMTRVLYSGEKQMPKFTRYMRIGYK
jgi:hypothetical protein